MKTSSKVFLFLLVLNLLPLSLSADYFEVKARAACFFPTATLIKKIYDSEIAQYQIEASYRFCNPLSIWANGAYTTDNGRSIGEHDKTQLRLWPISAGLKYTLDLPCGFETYLGLGGTYSLLRIHDHSPFVTQHVRRYRFGGIVKTGIVYRFCNWALVEIFSDYYYTKFHFHGTKNNVERNDLNVSGFLVGGGVGFTF